MSVVVKGSTFGLVVARVVAAVEGKLRAVYSHGSNGLDSAVARQGNVVAKGPNEHWQWPWSLVSGFWNGVRSDGTDAVATAA